VEQARFGHFGEDRMSRSGWMNLIPKQMGSRQASAVSAD
jgi:hypothetical protein